VAHGIGITQNLGTASQPAILPSKIDVGHLISNMRLCAKGQPTLADDIRVEHLL
jgi:hypothetical protein